MSADNRSTHTDALATLGTIINEGEKRDAIHLGVEPAIAGENLKPGQHVGFNKEGKAVWKREGVKDVGIVDPFITKREGVKEGERFWLIVYPRQITSLRHVWEHPDFPDSRETGGKELLVETPATEEQRHKLGLVIDEPKAMAKQRMMDWCDNMDVEVSELLYHARQHAHDGWHHWVDGGKFEGESLYEGFWTDFNTVEGTQEPNHGSFLSCSC